MRRPAAALPERYGAKGAMYDYDTEAGGTRFNCGPFTRHRLAALLAPFGIKPQTIRIGTGTAKGYQRAQFDYAFARYLAAPGQANSISQPAIEP